MHIVSRDFHMPVKHIFYDSFLIFYDEKTEKKIITERLTLFLSKEAFSFIESAIDYLLSH